MKRKGNKSKGNECLKSGKGKENEEKGREEARETNFEREKTEGI